MTIVAKTKCDRCGDKVRSVPGNFAFHELGWRRIEMVRPDGPRIVVDLCPECSTKPTFVATPSEIVR